MFAWPSDMLWPSSCLSDCRIVLLPAAVLPTTHASPPWFTFVPMVPRPICPAPQFAFAGKNRTRCLFAPATYPSCAAALVAASFQSANEPCSVAHVCADWYHAVVPTREKVTLPP